MNLPGYPPLLEPCLLMMISSLAEKRDDDSTSVLTIQLDGKTAGKKSKRSVDSTSSDLSEAKLQQLADAREKSIQSRGTSPACERGEILNSAYPRLHRCKRKLPKISSELGGRRAQDHIRCL